MKNYSKLNLTNHHSDGKGNPEDDLEANENEFKGVCYTGISLFAFVIAVIISIGFLVF